MGDKNLPRNIKIIKICMCKVHKCRFFRFFLCILPIKFKQPT